MIVVAAGSATRFGGEKLLADIGGKPLISHTIEAVSAVSDTVVVVARSDLVQPFKDLGHDIIVTKGGQTRTDSELAGLAALGREYDLIGIHDGARPLVKASLMERLFEKADEVGGAAPTLEPERLLVDSLSLRPIVNAVTVQTPQVFRGPGLLAAYVKAAQTAVVAHDSVEVVQRFGDLDIALVEGDRENIKVTFQADLEMVRSRLEAASHNEPQ